jgi:hypothetical protein
MSDPCFICLSKFAHEIRTDLVCSCKIVAHQNCWKSYIDQKGHLECPICHTVHRRNPMEMAMREDLRQPIAVQQTQCTNEKFAEDSKKCCLAFCCLEIAIFTILGFVLG